MIYMIFARLQEKNKKLFKFLKKGLASFFHKPGLKKKKTKKKVFYFLLFLKISAVLIFVVLPVLIFAIYHLVFWQKIYPFVKIANRELSGKTKTGAVAILDNLVRQREERTVNFVFEDKNYQLILADLQVYYKPLATVEKAYNLGRENSFIDNLEDKLSLWQNRANLPLDYDLNELKLEEFLATVSGQINSPAIPATIEVVNKEVIVEPGKPGRKVDRQILKQVLFQKLGFLGNEPIFIPVSHELPPVTQQQAEKTRGRAEKLIGKSIICKAPDFSNTLSDKELINFLSFIDSFDEGKIASWTGELAGSINRPPQNALFRFESGRVLEFKPAKDGLTLNQEKTTELIVSSIESLETSEEKTITIDLPVAAEQPAIATSDVNDLGIVELIGRGESWFWGSIASRIHNIQLAASQFNGVLIPPNETFSFNKTVGEIDQAHGYQQAYIIKEGRTVLGDGGGVCQVSTTFFRAALNVGLPIVERRAHAYRVSYYEQNTQVGQDATVFEPTVDLKVKNDTPAHILIQTRVDLTNRKLTFEFYGTADGREVFISKSRIWDQAPPPPDVYQDDPTLPAGTVKQIDWAAWGAKTAFDWKVTRDGEVLQEKTFYSSYRPWQAVFLRGTG